MYQLFNLEFANALQDVMLRHRQPQILDRASKDIYFLQMEAGGGDVCVKDQKFLFLLNLVPDFSYLPYVLPEFTDLNHLRHIADKNSLQAL
ncbi:hypothetical protein NC653_028899 [Populus alba x Populus x berolinensis]|uniref:Uncharacterized protein n=1 Tax=Populus alba x Populus x berolinensis TaxID=444605 RepID=A0AAD6Q4M4_9ROSI|nr:hypothetical protein NC653_028899 [Populus alba x Populus x berolinensis]